jgi:hypothetical protein
VKAKESTPHIRPNTMAKPELDEALQRLPAWQLVHRPNQLRRADH